MKFCRVTKILSDDIGLSASLEHSLPWYPPICQTSDAEDKSIDKKYFPASLLRNGLNSVQLSPETYVHLQFVFLNYVNQGKVSEAEIGQRIITAIEKV